MKKIRARLTYANVMSSIAVFLVLGGGAALAAKHQLAKNSVGTRQLKKNAVTKAKIKKNSIVTAKIKNDAVNGAKVDEATLSTVPSATNATNATNATVASSLTPTEAIHLVGAPGQPGFEGGSHNYVPEGPVPYGFNPVGFYKDHEGIVHLEGVAETGPTGIVFTLPPGFRPATNKIIPWNLASFNEGVTSPGGESVYGEVESGEALIVGSGVVSGPVDLSGKIAGEPEAFVILDGLTYRPGS